MATHDQSSLDYLAGHFGERVVACDALRHQGGEPAGQGPTGWIMPAYIAGDRDRRPATARCPRRLSRCGHLVHNGSSLARTVLLDRPTLAHTNTHTQGRSGPAAWRATGSSYAVDGGGHAWPGGEPGWIGGDVPTTEVVATDLIWDFFAAHPMPSTPAYKAPVSGSHVPTRRAAISRWRKC